MSDMKAYLAQRYMSGPKAEAILARSSDPSIKKRRKKPKNEDYVTKLEEGEGLKMRDEDEWRGKGEDVEMGDGDDAPIVGKSLATFQKSKSTWATVGSTSLPLAQAGPSGTTDTNDNDMDEDVKPDIEAEQAKEKEKEKKVLTTRKGGLRTAAQIREEAKALAAERAAAEEARQAEASTSGGQGQGQGQGETVHRDSSGRKVDVEALKREAKEKEDEEKRKAREREEWSKGMVQREGREARAREEREMGGRDVARYADDVHINREMREVERWNDPAAEFLTRRRRIKGPRRPKYNGPSAPNRFNILPGYRWDGVDRSNGFEKKYFQHQNTVARRTYQADQMGMEDM